MKNYYTCPFCHQKQNSVLIWETASIAYEKDFENGSYEERDRVGGEFETFACPECGRELPSDMDSEIKKLCGW